jgi:hypothetical protein
MRAMVHAPRGVRQGMRVAFIGCRDWLDDHVVRREIEKCRRHHGDTFHVVTGDATGADASALSVAKHLGIPHTEHEADWDRLGKRAGPERNGRIVADADACVAFWDGQSRGTLDCITQFVRAGKPVRIVARQR